MNHWQNNSLEDIDGEIWKDVVGYEGQYMVSNYSRVKSLNKVVNAVNGFTSTKKSKVLKQILNACYLGISFSNKNKIKRVMIHRIVAEAFIPNPENKKTVNHVDGNKLNNSIANLEWATYSENIKHAYKMGLSKPNPTNKGKFGILHANSKKIVRIKGAEIKRYDSISDAFRETGISVSQIATVCRGYRNRTSAGGYGWAFLENYELLKNKFDK